MIVDITEINSEAPYRVCWETEGKSLLFSTHNGFEYKVTFFRDDHLFAGLPVSRFSFSPSDTPAADRHIFDPGVKETVFQILKNFLSRNHQVMVFICDNDDGRQKNRFRLFNTWFLKTNKAFEEKFVVQPVEYSQEGISFYAGMVLRSDHPSKEQYLNALYKYMQLLQDEKS
jgi:hypothetical protein